MLTKLTNLNEMLLFFSQFFLFQKFSLFKIVGEEHDYVIHFKNIL